jgi:phosphatidate phosphatase APP1
MESDEVAAARVEIRFAGASQIAVADTEGYFRAWLRPQEPLPERLWHEVEMLLRDPPSPGVTKGEIMTPLPGATFGVISDLDDTVIQTDVTRPVRMFRSVLLGNARTRLPFEGVAEFYRALHAGPTGAEANPIFYVSSSPWNFYDLLVEFLELNGIPRGPLFLRDWGVTEDAILPTDHRGHKFGQIRQILDTYPLPFILIGDSGQRDPEIYREVVAEQPNRILAIYIRSVTANPMRAERIRALAEEVRVAGSALVLSEDTHGAVRHAVEQGWIVGSG